MVFVPHAGPQEYLLGSRAIPEIFFGGARGGGKSASLLGDFEQDAHENEHWRGLFLRRTYPELEEVIQQSYRFFTLSGATYKASSRTWIWPSGARLKMRSLERPADASKFQGQEFSWIGWDELTNWAVSDAYTALIGCLRTSGKVRFPRIRASGNPGGPGHQWVKARFQLGALNKGYRIIRQPETGLDRMYIPSLTRDNPSLLKNSPNYIKMLQAVGSPELVKAWLYGDWDIVLGAYFPEWSEPIHVIDDIDLRSLPRGWQVYRAYDHGSYHPFCVLWYTVAGAGMRGIPKGTIIILREWYGGDDDGKGLKLSLAQIGEGIAEREHDFGVPVQDGPADNQIFEHDGGRPMSEILAQYGAYFTHSDKRRLPGWNQVRTRLQQNTLKVCRSCKATRMTFPLAQHDQSKMEDVDTNGNDHALDVVRYISMRYPIDPVEPPKIEEARGIATYDELIADVERLTNKRW